MPKMARRARARPSIASAGSTASRSWTRQTPVLAFIRSSSPSSVVTLTHAQDGRCRPRYDLGHVLERLEAGEDPLSGRDAIDRRSRPGTTLAIHSWTTG